MNHGGDLIIRRLLSTCRLTRDYLGHPGCFIQFRGHDPIVNHHLQISRILGHREEAWVGQGPLIPQYREPWTGQVEFSVFKENR
jgi:hypothetical protein